MNTELEFTLDEAVAEVLGTLTGLDLEYEPELDRYRAITRSLNRALRACALDNEWAYYASTRPVGSASCSSMDVLLNSSIRPRIIGDDAVRLVDSDGTVQVWAYFLPRDALHKYSNKQGLWCSIMGQSLRFNRHFTDAEEGLTIEVPVMREPKMFRLPETGEEVPDHIRNQLVDFPYPDFIVARAVYFYAQSDPVMQPRVPTLEENYKTLMYQLIERDTQHTDSAYINEYILPLENGLTGPPWPPVHTHPHSNFQ